MKMRIQFSKKGFLGLLFTRFIACLLIITVIVLWSCRKEMVINDQIPKSEYSQNQGSKEFKSLSIQEAKEWYSQIQLEKLGALQKDNSALGLRSNMPENTTQSVTSTNVIPVWAKASTGLYGGAKPIVIVPFGEPSYFRYNNSKMAYLILFRLPNNQIKSRILVFEADGNIQNNAPINLNTFTGITYQINESGNVGILYKCESGQIVGKHIFNNSNSLTLRNECSVGPGYGTCPDFGKDTWDRIMDSRLITAIRTFFRKCCRSNRTNNQNDTTSTNQNTNNSTPVVTGDSNDDILNLNDGQDLPCNCDSGNDENTGSGGTVGIGDMLRQSDFSSVNFSIATCANGDYEDIMNFGLRLSEPQVIANAPALVVFKNFGHLWASRYIEAALKHYEQRLHNLDFATSLKNVVTNQHGTGMMSGLSPSSSSPEMRAAYPSLLGIYDRMMVDLSSSGSNCSSFTYTVDESFRGFSELFADNLFRELGINASGIDNEKKQQAVGWLVMKSYFDKDCIETYFELMRNKPQVLSGSSPYLFSSAYMGLKDYGFSIQQISTIYRNLALLDAVSNVQFHPNLTDNQKSTILNEFRVNYDWNNTITPTQGEPSNQSDSKLDLDNLQQNSYFRGLSSADIRQMVRQRFPNLEQYQVNISAGVALENAYHWFTGLPRGANLLALPRKGRANNDLSSIAGRVTRPDFRYATTGLSANGIVENFPYGGNIEVKVPQNQISLSTNNWQISAEIGLSADAGGESIHAFRSGTRAGMVKAGSFTLVLPFGATYSSDIEEECTRLGVNFYISYAFIGQNNEIV
jgi:hypothetical protein